MEAGVTDVKKISADVANKPWSNLSEKSKWVPPYAKGVSVRQFETVAEQKFVRVYGGNSEMGGQWIARATNQVILGLYFQDNVACDEILPNVVIASLADAWQMKLVDMAITW